MYSNDSILPLFQYLAEESAIWIVAPYAPLQHVSKACEQPVAGKPGLELWVLMAVAYLGLYKPTNYISALPAYPSAHAYKFGVS